MDDIKTLFEDKESINLEDFEKAYKMQMSNLLRQLTNGIKLAKQMQDNLYFSTSNHMKETELSDKLEELIGTDSYIETFFTNQEIVNLLKIKEQEEKITKLKKQNGHYQRYRIKRVNGGKANPLTKVLTRKDLQKSYEEQYKEYKYKKRRIGLNAKNLKKILEGNYPKELKKFAAFNLDSTVDEKYRIFDYKQWMYNKIINEEEKGE